MLWTLGGAAATLVAWGLWAWGHVVAVRFQWVGAGTQWRVTVSVAGAHGPHRLTAPLEIPSPPSGRQAPGVVGLIHPSWRRGLSAASAVLGRRPRAGRLWTRGQVALGGAASSAVVVGATQAALGLWYGAHLAPLAVRYLRVRWEADPLADQFAWHGRLGGIFRFRLGDIMQAILVGLWVLRRSPQQEAIARGQQ